MKLFFCIAAIAATLAVIDLLCSPWTIPADQHFDVLEDDNDGYSFTGYSDTYHRTGGYDEARR